MLAQCVSDSNVKMLTDQPRFPVLRFFPRLFPCEPKTRREKWRVSGPRNPHANAVRLILDSRKGRWDGKRRNVQPTRVLLVAVRPVPSRPVGLPRVLPTQFESGGTREQPRAKVTAQNATPASSNLAKISSGTFITGSSLRPFPPSARARG